MIKTKREMLCGEGREHLWCDCSWLRRMFQQSPHWEGVDALGAFYLALWEGTVLGENCSAPCQQILPSQEEKFEQGLVFTGSGLCPVICIKIKIIWDVEQGGTYEGPAVFVFVCWVLVTLGGVNTDLAGLWVINPTQGTGLIDQWWQGQWSQHLFFIRNLQENGPDRLLFFDDPGNSLTKISVIRLGCSGFSTGIWQVSWSTDRTDQRI